MSRQAFESIGLTSSVGWFGSVAAFLALAVAGLIIQENQRCETGRHSNGDSAKTHPPAGLTHPVRLRDLRRDGSNSLTGVRCLGQRVRRAIPVVAVDETSHALAADRAQMVAAATQAVGRGRALRAGNPADLVQTLPRPPALTHPRGEERRERLTGRR